MRMGWRINCTSYLLYTHMQSGINIYIYIPTWQVGVILRRLITGLILHYGRLKPIIRNHSGPAELSIIRRQTFFFCVLRKISLGVGDYVLSCVYTRVYIELSSNINSETGLYLPSLGSLLKSPRQQMRIENEWGKRKETAIRDSVR